jgi:hypothetical protein
MNMPAGVDVVGIEPRWSLFALQRASIAGRTGILIQSQRRGDPPAPADWSEVVPLGTVARMQNGGVAEGYRLYRVVGRAGGMAAAVMPRP